MSQDGEVRRMYALAARQHGAVTRAQLRGLGLTDDRIDRRIATGTLRVLHRGVFLVGPVTLEHTCTMAAVLACGAGAVVSHVSAAVVWRIASIRPDAEVHVTMSRPGRRRRHGIRVHESMLNADEITRRDRIPVTSCARTLLDLAATAPARELERAFAEAQALRLVSEAHLQRTVERHEGSRGSARLRALLNSEPPAQTRSQAEENLLALIRRGGLPAPRLNTRVGGFEVDFHWSAERLIVEVDGFAFHASRQRFEGDRRRDGDLMAAGYRVIRITWKQLEKEPEGVLVRLTQALMQSR